jgi:hypothetical protein
MTLKRLSHIEVWPLQNKPSDIKVQRASELMEKLVKPSTIAQPERVRSDNHHGGNSQRRVRRHG